MNSRKILIYWFRWTVDWEQGIVTPKLATEFAKHLQKNVNPQTVRIFLRKHHCNGRVARRKPFISARNHRTRVKFAKEHFNKNIDFCYKILFTDESKYLKLQNSASTLEKWNISNNFIFYQDNKLTSSKNSYCGIGSTTVQSPDMNVIENLWAQ